MFASTAVPLGTAQASPEVTQRQLRFTMQIANPVNRTLEQQSVWCSLRPSQHNWAQLHLLGAWRTVDAQVQRWWNDSDYVAFHAIADDASLNRLGRSHRFRATMPLTVSM